MHQTLRKLLFSIAPEETGCARRGFYVDSIHIQTHLEQIGRTFLAGYHAALEHDQPTVLAQRLSAEEVSLQGFAYEGAAMALTLLDRLLPWPQRGAGPRLQAFLAGPGAAHRYMIHVGAGWALARLPWRTQWPPAWLDPLLGWLAVDGYGFHQGYFYWPQFLARQTIPQHLSPYARRVFDQGLGRSLWFVAGANVERITQAITAFSPARQADLWSGIGLACAYAGGVPHDQIQRLCAASQAHRPALAQGVAFAAKARCRGGNVTAHTEDACEVVCGVSLDTAAIITDEALIDLPPDGEVPAYEHWRRRIQAQFHSFANAHRGSVHPGGDRREPVGRPLEQVS